MELEVIEFSFPALAYDFVSSGPKKIITTLTVCPWVFLFYPVMKNHMCLHRERKIEELPAFLNTISVYLPFDYYFYDLFQFVFGLVTKTVKLR